MEKYYISNFRKDRQKQRTRNKIIKFFLKLTTLIILVGILGYIINKNSDFLREMFYSYQLIQECQTLEKIDGIVANEELKSGCAIIGIELK